MISVTRAHEIGQHWREQFTDEAAYEESWRRFWAMVGDPTEDKLEQWLTKDQAKDAALNAGVTHEPVYPTRQRYTTTDCWHCAGNGYVRRDVAVGHPDFGKAFACPACNGGNLARVLAPTE